MTDVACGFAPNQTLPPGYRVVWSDHDEMYRWLRGEEEGPACCCRFMARRMAWANYRKPERTSA